MRCQIRVVDDMRVGDEVVRYGQPFGSGVGICQRLAITRPISSQYQRAL